MPKLKKLAEKYDAFDLYWIDPEEFDNDLRELRNAPLEGEIPVVMSDLWTYSDYIGSSVERSNYSVLKDYLEEESDLEEGEDWWAVSDSYGGESLVIRADVVDDELYDMLESLTDYPVFDDEDLSAREWEAVTESWDDFYGNEVVEALERAWDVEFDDRSDARDFLFEHPAVQNVLGNYVIHEPGGHAFIDAEGLAKEILEDRKLRDEMLCKVEYYDLSEEED